MTYKNIYMNLQSLERKAVEAGVFWVPQTGAGCAIGLGLPGVIPFLSKKRSEDLFSLLGVNCLVESGFNEFEGMTLKEARSLQGYNDRCIGEYLCDTKTSLVLGNRPFKRYELVMSWLEQKIKEEDGTYV